MSTVVKPGDTKPCTRKDCEGTMVAKRIRPIPPFDLGERPLSEFDGWECQDEGCGWAEPLSPGEVLSKT